jgi:hypothetical protein
MGFSVANTSFNQLMGYSSLAAEAASRRAAKPRTCNDWRHCLLSHDYWFSCNNLIVYCRK